MVSSEKNNISNHFYSTLEGEERGKGREKSPFAVLIALQCLREAPLSLSKLTQPGPCAPGSAQPLGAEWPLWAIRDASGVLLGPPPLACMSSLHGDPAREVVTLSSRRRALSTPTTVARVGGEGHDGLAFGVLS